MFLSHLARTEKSCSELRKTYPDYFMSKKKVELSPEINVDKILEGVKKKYSDYEINIVDGVKIDFSKSQISGWVHLRKSNTEPVIRIYTESTSQVNADNLADKIISEIKEMSR